MTTLRVVSKGRTPGGDELMDGTAAAWADVCERKLLLVWRQSRKAAEVALRRWGCRQIEADDVANTVVVDFLKKLKKATSSF